MQNWAALEVAARERERSGDDLFDEAEGGRVGPHEGRINHFPDNGQVLRLLARGRQQQVATGRIRPFRP